MKPYNAWVLRQQKGWGEVGGVNHRVLCLAVRRPLLALRKCYSHCVGVSFLVEKAVWVLNRCLLAEDTDYCMLINEWVGLSSGVAL